MSQISHSRLGTLAINDEGFAFDPRSGESFTVNTTGRRIIQALLADSSEESIVQELSRDYLMDLREARSDVRDFMEQLRALQLLGA